MSIIGIVAALTLPTLVADYQKQQTVAQLKKAVSTVSQARILSIQDGGEIVSGTDYCRDITPDIFADTYIRPYFKTTQICTNTNTGNFCGYNSNYPWRNIDGSNPYSGFYIGDNQTAAFKLPNGVIIWMVFKYGGSVCTDDVTIDINGPKGPNSLGKDAFIFGISWVSGKLYGKGSGDCSKSNGKPCGGKILNDGWEIAPDYPW